jgi:hypothetical protein
MVCEDLHFTDVKIISDFGDFIGDDMICNAPHAIALGRALLRTIS